MREWRQPGGLKSARASIVNLDERTRILGIARLARKGTSGAMDDIGADPIIPNQLSLFARARLTWRLLRDPRVASWTKLAIPVVALIYLVVPFDLIPDFILGFGEIDDLGVIGIAIYAMTRVLPALAPRWLVQEHLRSMRAGRGARRQNVVDARFDVYPTADKSSSRRNAEFQEKKG